VAKYQPMDSVLVRPGYCGHGHGRGGGAVAGVVVSSHADGSYTVRCSEVGARVDYRATWEEPNLPEVALEFVANQMEQGSGVPSASSAGRNGRAGSGVCGVLEVPLKEDKNDEDDYSERLRALGEGEEGGQYVSVFDSYASSERVESEESHSDPERDPRPTVAVGTTVWVGDPVSPVRSTGLSRYDTAALVTTRLSDGGLQVMLEDGNEVAVRAGEWRTEPTVEEEEDVQVEAQSQEDVLLAEHMLLKEYFPCGSNLSACGEVGSPDRNYVSPGTSSVQSASPRAKAGSLGGEHPLQISAQTQSKTKTVSIASKSKKKQAPTEVRPLVDDFKLSQSAILCRYVQELNSYVCILPDLNRLSCDVSPHHNPILPHPTQVPLSVIEDASSLRKFMHSNVFSGMKRSKGQSLRYLLFENDKDAQSEYDEEKRLAAEKGVDWIDFVIAADQERSPPRVEIMAPGETSNLDEILEVQPSTIV